MMLEIKNDTFNMVERFLLRLALLVLLTVGLLKVIAPEIKSLGSYFMERQESSSTNHQSSNHQSTLGRP
jgi:hypothetical protein